MARAGQQIGIANFFLSCCGRRSQPLKRVYPMSALPPKADTVEYDRDARFVPPLLCSIAQNGFHCGVQIRLRAATMPQLWRRYGSRRSRGRGWKRSEEHTSELQSHVNLVCRLLLEKKKKKQKIAEKNNNTT